MTLVVVTARSDFEARCKRILSGVTPGPVYHGALDRPYTERHDRVLVDVGSVIRWPSPWSLIAAGWRHVHPHVQWAYAVSLVELEVRELTALVAITGGSVVFCSEFCKDVLKPLLVEQPTSSRELQHLLEQALGERTLVGAEVVWDLLEAAPDIRSVRTWARSRQQTYKELQRSLQRVGQRSPRELVTAFRLLWAIYLRDHGYSTSRIRHILHLSGDHPGLKLSGSFALGQKEVQRLQMPMLLHVYSNFLLRTSDGGVLRPTVLPKLPELGCMMRE